MGDGWPFDQPKNCAVFTLKSIVREGKPIRHVVHYAEDDGWGFYDGEEVEMEDALIVSLLSVVNRDSGVLDVADLPSGWQAWREMSSVPWQRSLCADE